MATPAATITPQSTTPLRIWLLSAVAGGIALVLSGALLGMLELARVQERRQAVAEIAHLNAREIGDRLEHALSATFALAAVVRQGNGRIDNFESLATEMIRTYGGIGALSIAPGGTIRQVVPRAGNEAIIGFNPLLHPTQKFEAERAIRSHALTLTGPYSLIQGGSGVVGRYPIFISNAQGDEKFWGFVHSSVHISELLKVTSIGNMEAAGYRFELSRIDPSDGKRVIFARTSEAPLNSPFNTTIRVPEGEWTLSVDGNGSVFSLSLLLGGFGIALFIAILVGSATLTLLRQPLLLQREIDERKAAQAELQMSTGRLREIINTMDSGILLWDREQKLMAWNDAFSKIFPGIDQQIRQGISYQELRIHLQSSSVPLPYDANKASDNWLATGIWDYILPDGRIIALQRMATSDGGRLSLHSDVSEIRRTNETLARNERMASLGKLVAGIAHEINTPIGNALMVATSMQQRSEEMTSLVSNGQLKRSSLENFLAAITDSDNIIVRNLTRAAELIQHFKQVAVDQTSDRRRIFDLAEAIEEIVSTLHPRLRHSAHRLDLALAPSIEMDSYPGALGQIIGNLLENALLHAFPERNEGAIRITSQALPDGQIEIIFSDDGIGIPEENLARVFDPFFTTRLGQGGSGLGLSIVQNLVHGLLGGEIKIASKVQQGTHFQIRLPKSAPSRPETPLQ